MADTLKFEALKSSNYYTWRENMKAVLILKDLWSAVEVDDAYEALEDAAKKTMDDKAAALMQVKITSELKHLIRDAGSAQAAWQALENTFRSQSVGRKAVLRQQLKALSRKKTEDVLSYVSRAEIIRTELRDACNEDIPDDAFTHYILDGLGRAYNAFVRQYRFGNETLDLADLKNRLLNVEMTVQQQDSQLSENYAPARAFYAKDRRPANGRRAQGGNSRSKANSHRKKKSGACHICGQFGHWKAECPQRADSERYKRAQNHSGPSVAYLALHSSPLTD